LRVDEGEYDPFALLKASFFRRVLDSSFNRERVDRAVDHVFDGRASTGDTARRRAGRTDHAG